jgi:hypothetical protein
LSHAPSRALRLGCAQVPSRRFRLSDASAIVERMFDTVVRCGDQLAGIMVRLDPDVLSGEDAQAWWHALDRIERLASGGKTLVARRMAATHSPSRSGQKTAAEKMARESGTSVGAAKDSLATSERLPELDKVQAAVRRGELSSTQAALISDAAAADPSAQDRLLALASRGSMPELREECGRVKAAADPDPDATYRKLHAARRLRRWTGPDGAWNLVARGTPEHGAIINAAINPILDRIFRAARRAGRREHPEVYAFDALIALANGEDGTEHATTPAGPADVDEAGDQADAAEAAVDSAQGGGTEAEAASTEQPSDAPDEGLVVAKPGPVTRPSSAGPAGPPQRQAGVASRYRALIRVDLEALLRGQVEPGEVCEISGVGPIPARRARKLLGDAVLHLVITRGVDVLNVTHLGRGPTAAQRVALAWAAPACTVEGCYRRRLENDHREPWATTRHTRLDELDPICEFHHDLKTYLGWALVQGTGKRAFVPPDDPRHPDNPGASSSCKTDRLAEARPPTRSAPQPARTDRRPSTAAGSGASRSRTGAQRRSPRPVAPLLFSPESGPDPPRPP